MSSAVAPVAPAAPVAPVDPHDDPIVASVPANQPICDALLYEAEEQETEQRARDYEYAARKVAKCPHNLFMMPPDDDEWIEHNLCGYTGHYVTDLVTLPRLKNAYDDGRNPYALFPPQWHKDMKADADINTIRTNIAFEALDGLCKDPGHAHRRFTASPRDSPYAVAHSFYTHYSWGFYADADEIYWWFYDNIKKMVVKE